ncbi:MAG: hypothetical protein QXS20_07860 [Candidatus Thorarchaeota archaeon]
MTIGYEVYEDGTLHEIEITKEGLDSTKVLCVVDDSTKSIYLWKGNKAGVRSKFIGARVATNLRTEYGFHFKVKPIDEGSEPPSFFTAVEGTTAARPVIKQGAPKAQVQPQAQPQASAAATPTESTSQATREQAAPTVVETQHVPEPKRTATPATAMRAPEPPRTTAAGTSVPPVPSADRVRLGAQPPSADVSTADEISPEIQEMIRELETTEPPEGYQRELLIVYNQLFTVVERKIKVFGQERVDRKIERVKDPPEGTFMAEGFIPRVIVKDGRVLGIELLKGTPDAILSPIKTEMKERLSDLISFFKSELEDASASAEVSRKAARRKLVAK